MNVKKFKTNKEMNNKMNDNRDCHSSHGLSSHESEESSECCPLRRDSFSDRFCDDLSEDILKWLTIEDKIKLISVSKQFRRSLDNIKHKQTILKVMSEKTNDRNSYPILLQDYLWSKFMDQTYYVHISRLDKILKTFPNIEEIYFDRYVFVVNKEEVLTTITQISSHLSAFSFDFCGTSAPEVTQFAQKFGPNLKSVEFCTSCDVNRILRFCPNLVSVSEVRFNRLFDNKEVLVKNLKKALKVCDIRDKELFEIFVKNNPNLSHLDIRLSLDSSADTCAVIAMLSQLKHLEILSIQMKDNDSYDNRMAKSVESIAMNCNKLKSFELDVSEGKAFDAKHFCEAFKKFSSLKRLSFRSTDSKFDGRLEIDCIKNCKQLTHLKLMSDQIDDNFFLEIDSVFPHLKSLKIFLRDELSDKALQPMARLKHLESLIVRRFGGQQLESITDSGLLSLINGCHRLHTIFIFNTLSITESTIKALYQKSVQNPRIFYKYYFPGIADICGHNREIQTKTQNICFAEDIKIFSQIKNNFN